MDTVTIFAITAIVVVLIFDYTNGFHDAANIIAPMIASRAMTPVQAVIIVASFEFLGPLLGGTAVANTIGKFINLNDASTVLSVAVVMCGVFGAIFWNILTWWYGIPSSSSHALVGGLAGAVIAAVGTSAVVWGFSELVTKGQFTGVTKVLLSLIISPLLGYVADPVAIQVAGRTRRRAEIVARRNSAPIKERRLRRPCDGGQENRDDQVTVFHPGGSDEVYRMQAT
jgi:PiT family inorganic phosphate transporter